MYLKVNKICWLFPILYFFMVWLTMSEVSEGTDFKAQVYALENIKNDPLFFFSSEEPFLYYATYNILYSICGISARLYIAILSFIYFSLLIITVEKLANIYIDIDLMDQDVTNIALFTCLCYSPIFICIARFHYAVTMVLIGLLILILKQNRLWNILGIIIMLAAFYAHEGIVIIYFIVGGAYLLHKFWLSKTENISFRNILIISISMIFLIIGPKVFSLITSIMGSKGLLNDRYAETYAQANSGDGAYLLVLILCLFGSMLLLLITSLYDRMNNLITAICISGLFMMCLCFNQKFFLVQRIFMFMPLFIGLSCMQVIGYEKNINLFKFLMLSVPSIYLCQLIIQRSVFFGNVF